LKHNRTENYTWLWN